MRAPSFLCVCALLAACTSQSSNPTQFILNGPSDVAFACMGNVFIPPDAGPEQQTEFRPFPPASCGSDPSKPPPTCSNTDAGPVESGKPGIPVDPIQAFFIPEKAQGTMHVGQFSGQPAYVDQDPFVPGVNGLSVGRLPVSAATSSDGCWVVVANSGSCDLAVVDVLRAFNARPDPVRVRQGVEGLGSRPAEILSMPSLPYNTTPLPTCESPSGTMFVSYPSCDLVARVDIATMQMIDGIRFQAGQPPAIVGPEVLSQCPNDCLSTTAATGLPDDDAGPADADAGTVEDAGPPEPEPETEPSALALEPNGSRLYIGTSASGNLIVVDLDATGRPTGVTSVPLEGATGIRKVAATGQVGMGRNNAGGRVNFAYAIGDDQAIHVVDVTPSRAPTECDAQIDRRYIRARGSGPVTTACYHLGDPNNPPRRVEADGPGIRLPNGVLPLDVGFAESFSCPETPPQPDVLRGFFAVVAALGPTSSLPRGVGYFINVTDRAFSAVQGTPDRDVPDIAFGMPHSLRDDTLRRWEVSVNTCNEPNLPATLGTFRLNAGFPQTFTSQFLTNAGVEDPETDELQPNLRRVLAFANFQGDEVCRTPPTNTIAYELSSLVLPQLRTALWPDPTLLTRTETFDVTYEGALATSDRRSQHGGGTVTVQDGARMRLEAAGANLCTLGPEPGDIARLLGCASQGDCAVDQTCYVHPAAPAGVAGMCVPSDQVLTYSGECFGILSTVRLYTAVETFDDHVVFVPRPRILNETPLDGCDPNVAAGDDPDNQCEQIEEAVLSAREAEAGEAQGGRPRHSFKCAVVPEIGRPPRCIETCAKGCEAGTICRADNGEGECLLGPIPDPKCVSPLQRYEMRAGDAFTVVSDAAGYRHPVVRAADGRCVLDATKSPLLNAKIRRDAPPCVGSGDQADQDELAIEPNPCTLEGVGEVWLDEGADGGVEAVRNRPSHIIRVRTPGLTFDISDVSQELKGFPGVRYSPIQIGDGFRFQLAAGNFPFIESAVQANLPLRIRKGVDGVLYVVDAGDSPSGTGTKGQIISIIGNSSSTAVAPIRFF